MKVAITGARGFLGWHTACRLRALYGIEAVGLGRAEVDDPVALASYVDNADVVLHLAGVNRAGSNEEVRSGNVQLASQVADAVRAGAAPKRVVYANSIQAKLVNPYGQAKAEGAEILRGATGEVGGSLANVLLPNLFGEHGRPRYNSFVATFSHHVANGETPEVADDKEVPLLHAQRAAAALIEAMTGESDSEVEPPAQPRMVSAVLSELLRFHELYQGGEIPALDSEFTVDLFNTYRSYTFPDRFPHYATVHADARGALFETVRSHGGTGQSFVSITSPGQSRGDHYHLRKIERFYVIRGTAEISLRRLLHDEVVSFRVGGDRPGFVDMPTMWVHNISNVGDDELITVFWADQLLDPASPDQYPERVHEEAT